MLMTEQRCLMTARLSLRALAPSDFADLRDVLTQRPVRRHLFDDRLVTSEDVIAMIATSRQLQRDSGTGLWALRRRLDEACVGIAGLWPLEKSTTCELAFALGCAHWGKGLAMEAGAAVVEYARTHLGWTTLRASTDPGNCASIRTLLRLDFHHLAFVSGPTGPLRVFQCAL